MSKRRGTSVQRRSALQLTGYGKSTLSKRRGKPRKYVSQGKPGDMFESPGENDAPMSLDHLSEPSDSMGTSSQDCFATPENVYVVDTEQSDSSECGTPQVGQNSSSPDFAFMQRYSPKVNKYSLKHVNMLKYRLNSIENKYKSKEVQKNLSSKRLSIKLSEPSETPGVPKIVIINCFKCEICHESFSKYEHYNFHLQKHFDSYEEYEEFMRKKEVNESGSSESYLDGSRETDANLNESDISGHGNDKTAGTYLEEQTQTCVEPKIQLPKVKALKCRKAVKICLKQLSPEIKDKYKLYTKVLNETRDNDSVESKEDSSIESKDQPKDEGIKTDSTSDPEVDNFEDSVSSKHTGGKEAVIRSIPETIVQTSALPKFKVKNKRIKTQTVDKTNERSEVICKITEDESPVLKRQKRNLTAKSGNNIGQNRQTFSQLSDNFPRKFPVPRKFEKKSSPKNIKKRNINLRSPSSNTSENLSVSCDKPRVETEANSVASTPVPENSSSDKQTSDANSDGEKLVNLDLSSNSNSTIGEVESSPCTSTPEEKDPKEVYVEKGDFKIRIKYSGKKKKSQRMIHNEKIETTEKEKVKKSRHVKSKPKKSAKTKDQSGHSKKPSVCAQSKDKSILTANINGDQVQVRRCEENDVIINDFCLPKLQSVSPEKIAVLKKQLEIKRGKKLRAKANLETNFTERAVTVSKAAVICQNSLKGTCDEPENENDVKELDDKLQDSGNHFDGNDNMASDQIATAGLMQKEKEEIRHSIGGQPISFNISDLSKEIVNSDNKQTDKMTGTLVQTKEPTVVDNMENCSFPTDNSLKVAKSNSGDCSFTDIPKTALHDIKVVEHLQLNSVNHTRSDNLISIQGTLQMNETSTVVSSKNGLKDFIDTDVDTEKMISQGFTFDNMNNDHVDDDDYHDDEEVELSSGSSDRFMEEIISLLKESPSEDVNDMVRQSDTPLKNDVNLMDAVYLSPNLSISGDCRNVSVKDELVSPKESLQSPLNSYDEADCATSFDLMASPNKIKGEEAYQPSFIAESINVPIIQSPTHTCRKETVQFEVAAEQQNSVVALPVNYPVAQMFKEKLQEEEKSRQMLDEAVNSGKNDTWTFMHQCKTCNKRFRSLNHLKLHASVSEHCFNSDLSTSEMSISDTQESIHPTCKRNRQEDKYIEIKKLLGQSPTCSHPNPDSGEQIVNVNETQKSDIKNSEHVLPQETLGKTTCITLETNHLDEQISYKIEVNKPVNEETNDIKCVTDCLQGMREIDIKKENLEVESRQKNRSCGETMTCPLCKTELNKVKFMQHKLTCGSGLNLEKESCDSSTDDSIPSLGKTYENTSGLYPDITEPVIESPCVKEQLQLSESDTFSDTSQASRSDLKVVLRRVNMCNLIMNGTSLKFCGSINNPLWKVIDNKRRRKEGKSISKCRSTRGHEKVNDAEHCSVDVKSNRILSKEISQEKQLQVHPDSEPRSCDQNQSDNITECIQTVLQPEESDVSMDQTLATSKQQVKSVVGNKTANKCSSQGEDITDFEKQLIVVDHSERKKRNKSGRKTQERNHKEPKKDSKRKPRLEQSKDPTEHFMRSKMAQKIYKRDQERVNHDGLPDFAKKGIKLDSLPELVVGRSVSEINNNEKHHRIKENKSFPTDVSSMNKSAKSLKESIESLGIVPKQTQKDNLGDFDMVHSGENCQKRTYGCIDSESSLQSYKIPKFDFNSSRFNSIGSTIGFSGHDTQSSLGSGPNSSYISWSGFTSGNSDISSIEDTNNCTMMDPHGTIGSLTPTSQTSCYGGFNFSKTGKGSVFYSPKDPWQSFIENKNLETSHTSLMNWPENVEKRKFIVSSTPFHDHKKDTNENVTKLEISQLSSIHEKADTPVKKPKLKRFVLEDTDRRVVIQRDFENSNLDKEYDKSSTMFQPIREGQEEHPLKRKCWRKKQPKPTATSSINKNTEDQNRDNIDAANEVQETPFLEAQTTNDDDLCDKQEENEENHLICKESEHLSVVKDQSDKFQDMEVPNDITEPVRNENQVDLFMQSDCNTETDIGRKKQSNMGTKEAMDCHSKDLNETKSRKGFNISDIKVNNTEQQEGGNSRTTDISDNEGKKYASDSNSDNLDTVVEKRAINSLDQNVDMDIDSDKDIPDDKSEQREHLTDISDIEASDKEPEERDCINPTEVNDTNSVNSVIDSDTGNDHEKSDSESVDNTHVESERDDDDDDDDDEEAKSKSKEPVKVELTEITDDVLYLSDPDMDMFLKEELQDNEDDRIFSRPTSPIKVSENAVENGNGTDFKRGDSSEQQELTRRPQAKGTSKEPEENEDRTSKRENNQRLIWMPKGYCFNFFNKGRCAFPQCTYDHNPPSQKVLIQSFKENFWNEGEICLDILRSHPSIQDKIPKQQLEALYRRVCNNVDCFWLLKVMNDRGMLNQMMIDNYIRNFAYPKHSDYLYGMFEMAKGINIQLQQDVMGQLLKVFSSQESFLDMLVAVMIYSTEDENFQVPVEYISIVINGVLKVPRLSNTVLPWLLDTQQLQNLSPDLITKLSVVLEKNNVQKEVITKLKDVLNQLGSGPEFSPTTETDFSDTQDQEQEESSSWSVEDEQYWKANVTSVKYSKDFNLLASLFDEKRNKEIPFTKDECELYISVISENRKSADSAFSQFLDSIKSGGSTGRGSPNAFDNQLVAVAYGVFKTCFNDQLSQVCMGILNAMGSHNLSPCSMDSFWLLSLEACIPAAEFSYAMKLLKGTHVDKMEPRLQEAVIGFCHRLVEQLGRQCLLLDCFYVVHLAFRLVYNGKANVIQRERLINLPEICRGLIFAFIDQNYPNLAVEVYRLVQQYGQSFPTNPKLEFKLMVCLTETQYKAAAISAYEKLKKLDFYKPQVFTSPRKITIPCLTYPDFVAEVILIVEDYLMCLYNRFCDDVMANKPLLTSNLHLKVFILCNIHQANILQDTKTILETKLNPPLHSTKDYGCLVIKPDSLQNYLNELDKNGRCQGLQFSMRPGPRSYRQQKMHRR